MYFKKAPSISDPNKFNVNLNKRFLKLLKSSFYTLGIKTIKQSVVLGIALLVSFLINLPRVLALFNIVKEVDTFSHASVQDIIVRFVFLFLYSWVILQYCLHWRFTIANLPKLGRIVMDVVVSVFLFMGFADLFFWGYEHWIGIRLEQPETGILYFVYIVILIILWFIAGILRYQAIHQEDMIEKEFLKRQSVQNELEALKNQINPHFLFNSLNSLNSLVRDNKEATMFVNKLSFMYRYILQSGHEDLVSLEDELKFLKSYIYLIKTRYRERFTIDIQIDALWMHHTLPALGLQLLVENAVKHNEISSTHPLHVKVYTESDYVVVENIIRPRNTFVDSTGNGLVNLDKRCRMLKKQPIVIQDSDGVFKVKIPLN